MSPGLPFSRIGPSEPLTPLIVAVPHAGRDYPQALLATSRLPLERLQLLEDRFADLLVNDIAADGATVLIAHRARAWIDLNRDPREIDPAMVVPTPPDVVRSARVRGGLGLIPRIVGGADIHAAPLALDAVRARIAADHAPWHAALDAAIAAAHARFGVAILIDCHTMPPLPGGRPLAVLGDRFGRSAGEALVAAAERVLARAGIASARNQPYAGGYTLDRYGRPARGVHALQIEFCRSLYLDAARRQPASGIERVRHVLAAIGQAILAETDRGILAAE